jgi:hypothetical protein
MQDINGQVTESVDIDSTYEYKNGNARICDLPSVAKKKVIAVLMSSTKAFPMVGLALQVEVPMMAVSIPGQKVGEECWNSSLDARLKTMMASIQLEAVAATSKSARLRETLLMTSRMLDPYESPVT